MLKLLCIHDKKSGLFLTPFTAKSTIDGLRQVSTVANDPKSLMHTFADDYEVMLLGEFNEENGAVTIPPAPVFIENITALLGAKNVA